MKTTTKQKQKQIKKREAVLYPNLRFFIVFECFHLLNILGFICSTVKYTK